MKVLLDTNILLRVAEKQAPEYHDVVTAVASLLSRGDELLITPQVLIEFWSVATRPPKVNGFGWTPVQTRQAIEGFLAQFALLEDTPLVFTRWLALITANDTRGKQVHDARLAAVMLTYAVTTILTLNPKHFSGFTGITVLEPRDV